MSLPKRLVTLVSPTLFIFWHSGSLALSARVSEYKKMRKGGLNQPDPEHFEV